MIHQKLFDIQISNKDQWRDFCLQFLKILTDENGKTVAPILLLQGVMGVGKTEFVKVLCEIFKMSGVRSPSFSIYQTYKNSESLQIHHIDLFRLKNEEDLESTGFWDLFQDNSSWMIIEWPERLNFEDLPFHRPKYLFEFSFVESEVVTEGRQVQVSRLV